MKAKRRPAGAALAEDRLAGSIADQSTTEVSVRVHSLARVSAAMDDGTWPATSEILDAVDALVVAASSWAARAEFEACVR
jgi:hypothetical protein